MPSRQHKYRHVTEAVYGAPWAILPGKLEEILALLDRRAEAPATAEELRAFAASEGEGSDEPYCVTPGGVAVLDLSGVIAQRMNLMMQFSGGTSCEQFTSAFQQALKDPNVKAIVLDVNSPGGSVGGVAEAANAVFAARGVKPVVAVANTLCASAAYWIASAASQVVASPSASVGSVGVYMVHSERSKANASAGVNRQVISAGKYKAISNEHTPLSDEARGRLQSYIASVYDAFAGAVARHRGTTITAVQNGYGEGDTLFAADAVAAGLADRCATLSEVIAELESQVSSPVHASVPVAAVSANPFPVSQIGVSRMNPKLKAALIARGLITAEASDEVAQAALGAFFAARAVAAPTDPEAAITALFAAPALLAAAPLAPAVQDTAALENRVAERVTAAELHRVSTIRAAAEICGLDAQAAGEIVAQGLPVEQSTAAIRQRLSGANQPVPRSERIQATGSELEAFSAVAQEALEARCLSAANSSWGPANLSQGARELSGMGAFGLAEESLRRMGVNTRGMSRTQIAGLALQSDNPGVVAAAGGGAYYSTGNFANLTLNASRKVLVRGFQEADVSYRQWVRIGEPVQDFKPTSLIKFGEMSDLDLTPEGVDSPIDSGLTDGREWFQVETYSKMVSFTRQMLINDDLSALSRMQQMMGVAAARTFNKLVYKILTGNPTMADGVALFHTSSHGANLLGTGSTTAAPPSTTTLNAIQATMRKQTGLNSDALLNIPLSYVIVPAALESTALALLRSIGDPGQTNSAVKNIFYGRVEPIVEALLDGTSAVAWYGAAASGAIDTISVRFLAGEETPFTDDWYDPKSDARWFKVRQTGAAVLEDYRGIVKHTGYSA